MTQQELEKRKERAERETFVISRTDEGFRVYSPANPTKSYMVSGSAEALTCTCPDFQYHASDPQWQCKHILAVLNQRNKGNKQPAETDPYEVEERLAIRKEGRRAGKTEAQAPKDGVSQMLIKRSVSPDGRIDSLSVEFSSPVEKIPVKEIKSRALKTLKLQSEIVESFLGANSRENASPKGKEEDADGAAPAEMLNVGGMDGKWGRRLFINVKANGQTSKLFGTRKQLAASLAAAGFPKVAEQIAEGMQLNLPCRVVTKPSEDGRFLNIERVLPFEAPSRQRRVRQ